MADVRKEIIRAYKEFIKNDFHLLVVDANERSITHKFAEYLQIEFPEYDVDCEYNRNMVEPKRLDSFKKKLDSFKKDIKSDNDKGITVYPDIIVHHRGTEDNFIVIEAKKLNNQEECKKSPACDCDQCKLKAYKADLHYQEAYFIKFPSGKNLKFLGANCRERFNETFINDMIEPF